MGYLGVTNIFFSTFFLKNRFLKFFFRGQRRALQLVNNKFRAQKLHLLVKITMFQSRRQIETSPLLRIQLTRSSLHQSINQSYIFHCQCQGFKCWKNMLIKISITHSQAKVHSILEYYIFNKKNPSKLVNILSRYGFKLCSVKRPILLNE